MSSRFGYPEATGGTAREDIESIRSWLYQLTESLEYNFDTMEKRIQDLEAVSTGGTGTEEEGVAALRREYNAMKVTVQGIQDDVRYLGVRAADLERRVTALENDGGDDNGTD